MDLNPFLSNFVDCRGQSHLGQHWPLVFNLSIPSYTSYVLVVITIHGLFRVCFAVILGSVFNLFKHLKFFIRNGRNTSIRNGKNTS